jgi:hypothetical protein
LVQEATGHHGVVDKEKGRGGTDLVAPTPNELVDIR